MKNNHNTNKLYITFLLQKSVTNCGDDSYAHIAK